ncbi:hypothetical protein EMIHUDRAFT_229110 [Emiliania huxleyi CCMP1516]|uniref:Uncharacterized protein n=2 Tax=Emiliania huxleyi TaxID=2903 RepID=A0A0D3KDJ3_EMIH1|nr:hypothetical protein EMIHUDRAFT_229110 [Emiliania huxleyi CCMP1516]EOD33828.1 hypothetical protein EMIHUDRAFT_229110 [Emiliania huxleyi CCMP1516]|eukprot:XP_005786257.1 hypothetical protein EMIHUDRAFT_229110 [Emiliania huxleyi CCMP1516]
MPDLSLRLWAQPHAEEVLGTCLLLEHSPTTVLAVDRRGFAAVIVDEAARVGGSEEPELPEPWPSLQLCRSTAGGKPQWRRLDRSSAAGSSAAEPLDLASAARLAASEARSPLTPAGRRWVVDAIRGYYTQHVLEPSVRGFLSILEKQFPRSDLYLFELLQNAVDDGARVVRLELLPGPALRLSHDGRGFSPLDVNGLASVGMSTKQSRRAAGFMGIGFKACHKRFAHVRCADPDWRFDAWVLLPRWAEDSSGSPVASGCVFELLRPRGGLDALRRDLRWLPPSVPPLLARCALAADQRDGDAPRAAWELVWVGERLVCERVDGADAEEEASFFFQVDSNGVPCCGCGGDA